MANFKRDGLIEALEDFGVDMNWQGLEMALACVPVVSLGSIEHQLPPAIAARGYTNATAAAGGAATWTGLSITSLPTGFWLLGLRNNIANAVRGVRFSVNPGSGGSAIIPGAVSPLSFNWLGDEPGEAGFGQGVTPGSGPGPFLAATQVGVSVVDPSSFHPGLYFHLESALNSPVGNLARPVWVPGNCILNVFSDTANQSLDVSMEIEIPASTAGVFP